MIDRSLVHKRIYLTLLKYDDGLSNNNEKVREINRMLLSWELLWGIEEMVQLLVEADLRAHVQLGEPDSLIRDN